MVVEVHVIDAHDMSVNLTGLTRHACLHAVGTAAVLRGREASRMRATRASYRRECSSIDHPGLVHISKSRPVGT